MFRAGDDGAASCRRFLFGVHGSVTVQDGCITTAVPRERKQSGRGRLDLGEKAIELIQALSPGVVLLDVRMPKLASLDFLERFHESGKPPAILLLTTFDDDPTLLKGLRLGARGVLRKDISLDDLFSAIHAAASGQTVIRPAVTERVPDQVRQGRTGLESSILPEPLTAREIEAPA